jgi:hypothetical protein
MPPVYCPERRLLNAITEALRKHSKAAGKLVQLAAIGNTSEFAAAKSVAGEAMATYSAAVYEYHQHRLEHGC